MQPTRQANPPEVTGDGRGMLPAFDDDGLLPMGDHHLTIEQLRRSPLVVGPGASHPDWNVPQRRRLVDNLEVVVGQLWRVGVTSICIGGSFVEDRNYPYDIDGYFYCDFDQFRSGELQERLNRLDPPGAWDWDPRSRRPDSRGKLQYPLWHRYHIDLYPNHGQGTGVFDESFNEMNFYALMRWSPRVGRARGAIQLGGPS
jgi:hypothetical protein